MFLHRPGKAETDGAFCLALLYKRGFFRYSIKEQARAAAENCFYDGAEKILTQSSAGSSLSGEQESDLYEKTVQAADRMDAADRLCRELKRERYADVERVRALLYRVYLRLFYTSSEGVSPVAREDFSLMTLEQIHALFEQESVSRELLDELHTGDARVLRAADCVLRRFRQPELSIRAIAEEVGFSQNYLCTLFRQQTGSTLNDFILRVRLEAAKKLLRNTGLRLYEISSQVGIQDANYLSFIFKRETGMTPSAYRAERQNR